MTAPRCDTALVWFRRDLRDYDHAALHAALTSAQRVFCCFVFDTTILAGLPRHDRRVTFIYDSVTALRDALKQQGGDLLITHGDPADCIPLLARSLGVQAVFSNRDYEPKAIDRDKTVAKKLLADGIRFSSYKDQVIFDGDELLTGQGKPYTVFTPYKNAWLKRIQSEQGDFYLRSYPTGRHAHRLATPSSDLLAQYAMPTLEELAFDRADLGRLGIYPGMDGAQQCWANFQDRITSYRTARDFPAVRGVSYLSVHLRFGTVSIRELARFAWQMGGEGALCWLSELIWRDFYFMILSHFPTVEHHAFKPQFDALRWDEWPAGLQAWQTGQTGYPLVDAAMRQLAHSGYMHNRLRMVTAAFLTKDLGIAWQAGEAWFALHLNDFDLAANNGGWQWSASTGCDAQPWFRIFNPVTQSEKFDPQGKFIRRYVPELTAVPDKFIHAPWTLPLSEQQRLGVVIGRDYPAPIVDHAVARARTLQRYEQVKSAHD